MDIKKIYSKQSDLVKLVIVAVVIIVVLYFIKQAKIFFQTPVVNMANVPVIGTNESGQSIQWDPDPLAAEISQKLEGYNFNTYPDVAQKVLDLQTDDQLILLYNHYNKTYAVDYPTLTLLFSNEWDDWSGKYAEVATRLRGLGLN